MQPVEQRTLQPAFHRSASPRGLLIDCDGTITDPGLLPAVIEDVMRSAIEECGQVFSPSIFREVFHANKGGGVTKYYARYLAAAFDPRVAGLVLSQVGPQDMRERVVAGYVREIDAIIAGTSVREFKVRSGMREVMREARSKGIRVAVVTNADERITRANLRAAGIFEAGRVPQDCPSDHAVIDLLVHAGHYPDEDHRKPSGYPYQLACHRLGINPIDAIGIEDSQNGHQALRRAGIGLRVHAHESDLPKAPIIFTHKTTGVPPHVVVGPEEFGVEFWNGEVLPSYAARLHDPFHFAARLRQRLGLPLEPGQEKFLELPDAPLVEADILPIATINDAYDEPAI